MDVLQATFLNSHPFLSALEVDTQGVISFKGRAAMLSRLHKGGWEHASRPWESNPSSPPARGQHGGQILKQPRMTLRLRYVVPVKNLGKCAAYL